ncbi:MAG: hypothetical protein A2X24_00285 [Chloroflexi bacterium GWB2_54_36]|nr:MAG: hypothetical protein A2X24_00285 [Chloroflexi bacterium GWB2_54_36]
MLKYYEPEIESLTLIPSSSGRFEITVNQQLLFSKTELHRHAIPGEITTLISKYLTEGNPS